MREHATPAGHPLPHTPTPHDCTCGPPPPPQAADADVEGVVLHGLPDGGLAPAHICRGAGSFEAQLRTIGEPLPAADGGGGGGGEGEGGEGEGGPGQEREELPQAATVS